MKYLIFVLPLFYFKQAIGQNFITKDGEFMDTALDINQNCINNKFIYYYNVGGKYPKSSMTLLQEAKAFTEKQNNNYSGNGYITFRFTIGCEGKMLKRVQVIQTDGEYKKFHFDKTLINELFYYLKTLDKWKIAKSPSGETYSYISLMSFKIQNGKVANIIP